MKEIHDLDEMPMRFRFFPVDNYLVFYLPDKYKNMVSIVRIMYSGRDVRSLLNETKIEY